MTKRVTIPLTTPLEGPDGKIREIIIREPNVMEGLEIGDPYVVGSSPSGSQLVVENYEAITAYVRRCLVEPKDQALLQQGGVEVARALKEAVIGFFLPATAEAAASEISQTSSPSAVASGAASQTSGS